MQCPVCGSPLEKVPGGAKRRRCKSCRSVFDSAQLDRLYGVKSGDKDHSATEPYETAHMHEVHKQTGNAETRHVRQPDHHQVEDKQTPIVTSVVDDVRQQMQSAAMSRQSQPPVRNTQPAPQAQPPRQTTGKTGMPIGVKIILWIVIIFFLFPLTVIPFVVAIVDDMYSTVWNMYDFDNVSVNVESGGGSLDALKPQMTFETVEDRYYGDVLVVHVDWTNGALDRETTAYLALDVTAMDGNGKLLDEAYLGEGDHVGCDPYSRYDYIEPGDTGRADWTFIIGDTEDVDVVVKSTRDGLGSSGDVPSISEHVNLANGKIVGRWENNAPEPDSNVAGNDVKNG